MGDSAVYVELPTDRTDENADISGNELKRDFECIADTELNSSPNKKQAKEVSNDDVRSEVSDPKINSKEENNVLAFQDISSQRNELENANNQAECGEVTSTCLENSSLDETLSDGGGRDHNNSVSQNDKGVSSDETTSRVVLEIPENVSSYGIRKITLKFSKKREDYDDYQSLARTNMSYYGQEPSSVMEYGHSGDFNMYAPNRELKMSKKVVPSCYLTNVKKLLGTGILDGARVTYKYSHKSGKIELPGIIQGGGYLCGCSLCSFSRVLNAYEFEQHAGGKTRHPNNHIFLENGRPIYSIIQEIKTAPLSSVDDVIKKVAGSSLNEELFHVWKASLLQSNGQVEAEKNFNSKLVGMPHTTMSEFGDMSYMSCSDMPSHIEQQSHLKQTTDERKHVVKKSSSHPSYSGLLQKKTADSCNKRRDNDLHRLLFMPNGLPDGAELAYYVKGQKLLGGYKQGNGIVCGCCDKELSPSQFESHAGMAARRQPYRHIYTSNGLTLHDIALSLANGQNVTTGDSDDMCAVCGDGGDLILCNGCPRAFHAACLGLQCAPESCWLCQTCRDVSGCSRLSSTSRPIKIKLTRFVQEPEFEMGGCVVCREHDFSVAKFDERTVIICDQCEKEYHVGCLRVSGLCELEELPKDKWFCCGDCNRIYVELQNSVSAGAKIIPASLSAIINRKCEERGLPVDGGVSDEIQWRILSGKSRYPEDLPLLSRAAAIFRECFDPIVAASGRDLIPVMVYGRNISGQEFGGMYCVVLMVKSVVVSAGLLRIFGRHVAELPMVATSREHQGKGYFQVLFSCIEKLLLSLKVEKLVLPAAEDAESIWTRKLGFQKLTEEQISNYVREVQLTLFNKTSMLEKTVQLATE